jgi:ribosome-binding factor A
MESTRQKKVSRLLQKELGTIFQQNATLFEGKMITVTVVRISPDLSVAKVYLSFFPPKKEKDADPLSLVRRHTSQIRYELGQKIRNQLRIVPELSFFEDDSLDYIENIENLLS